MAEHPPEVLGQIRKEEEAQATPPPQFIFKQEEYADDAGRRVQERTAVSGELPEGFERYVSAHTVNVPPHLAPYLNGAQKVPYRFPIEGAKTLEEAFERWEHSARKFGGIHMKALEDRIREATGSGSGLVVPPPGAKLPPHPGSRPPGDGPVPGIHLP